MYVRAALLALALGHASATTKDDEVLAALHAVDDAQLMAEVARRNLAAPQDHRALKPNRPWESRAYPRNLMTSKKLDPRRRHRRLPFAAAAGREQWRAAFTPVSNRPIYNFDSGDISHKFSRPPAAARWRAARRRWPRRALAGPGWARSPSRGSGRARRRARAPPPPETAGGRP